MADPTPCSRQVFGNDPEHVTKFAALFHRLVRYFEYKPWDGPDDVSRDLAQETLSRGCQRLDAGVELTTDPLHYFFGIAGNVAREYRRTLRRKPTPLSFDEQTFRRGAEASQETGVLVTQLLASLSSDDREVFLAYHLGDRKALEESLGVTPAALRVRVHRMRARLKDLAVGART
jgi:DNA-directed RNA polymerase specialized sigma24 family protein